MFLLYKQLLVTSDCSTVARIRYQNMPLAALLYFSAQGLMTKESECC